MVARLSKDELLKALVDKTNFKKKDCEFFLSELSEVIIYALSNKKEVTLGSLGTFKYKQSKPRTCKVITTGKSIEVPAKGGANFKSSKKLKDSLVNVL